MSQIPSRPTQKFGKASSTLFQSAQTVGQPTANGSKARASNGKAPALEKPQASEQTQTDEKPTPSKRGMLFSWWERLNVRTKVTLLGLIVGTTPVLAIGVTAYYFANQSITNQIKLDRQNRAADLASAIDTFMTKRFSDIQLLSQVPMLRDSRLFEATPPDERVNFLDGYVKLYGVYNSVAFFNLNGDTILQAKGDPVPNHKTRDYFMRVVETEQPTINPPSISRTTGTLSMHLAAPVRDAVTDQLKGIVRFQLPVAGLETVAGPYAGEGQDFYVVDNSDNYFLASGSAERIGKSAAEHFAQYEQVKAAQAPASVVTVDPDTGKERLFTYVPLQNMAGLDELDFGVMLATDTEIAFAPQRQLLLTIEIGTLISALIVGVLSAIVANRATQPILAAAEAVRKIGQGDLKARLNIRGEDEIAVLGSNINTMATQLQESLDAQVMETAQERLLTLAKGSGAIRSGDLKSIFDQTLEGARSLLNLDRIVIYRFNTVASDSVVAESLSTGWSSALEENITDGCIPEETRADYRKGRVVVSNDITLSGFNPEHMKLLERLEVKASVMAPILGAGKLYGLLIAHRCESAYNWAESEVNFIKRLASELGLSIYRVDLLEETTILAEEQRKIKEELQRRALELLQEVDPISQGDLTIRARVTADEIGTIADSYNATVDNLRKIVVQVQTAADQVANTTTANEMSVQTLSEEALRQAEDIAKALGLVKDMAIAVREVAANAEKAQAAVKRAELTVKEGDAAMNRTVEGIQGIRNTVAETAKKVKHLGESSQKISTVVELISAFAAQTNMLALNASIEASRAGEEGKGFAVVANEVRALARQSADATEEIRKLVANIQAETNEVVAAMEEGTAQVVMGTKLVDETRQNLTKISETSTEISQLVGSIAKVTVTQTEASEAVSKTMNDIADVANKTSSEAMQVSESFRRLREVAQKLQSGVGQFKVG